ncbi:hypothetical protein Plhal304r1_c082g0166931 [Plasmopara halstedii]
MQGIARFLSITYVYPTLSARAVPQSKEFCKLISFIVADIELGYNLPNTSEG